MTESRATETVSPGDPSPGVVRILAPGTEIGARYAVKEALGTGGFAVGLRGRH